MIRHSAQHGCLAGSAESFPAGARDPDSMLFEDAENAPAARYLDPLSGAVNDDAERPVAPRLGTNGGEPLEVIELFRPAAPSSGDRIHQGTGPTAVHMGGRR